MTFEATPYDLRACELGEGPLWHPLQKRLYWFDIVNKRLLSRDGDTPLEWRFDEHHSAAGWVDQDRLLLASETGLWVFDTTTGNRELICPLEEYNPVTRSNDGRADPFGGFWIGTMGKSAEDAAGAIYRLYKGELRKLVPDVTIPNSICFAPDGACAFYTDTTVGKIIRQPLDSEGWPTGEASVFLDLGKEGINPDGSVVDADGAIWNAQWGLGRVARYTPDGALSAVVSVPATHTTCPSFGGPDFKTLFVTSAREGIEGPSADHGRVYTVDLEFTGQREHRVLL